MGLCHKCTSQTGQVCSCGRLLGTQPMFWGLCSFTRLGRYSRQLHKVPIALYLVCEVWRSFLYVDHNFLKKKRGVGGCSCCESPRFLSLRCNLAETKEGDGTWRLQVLSWLKKKNLMKWVSLICWRSGSADNTPVSVSSLGSVVHFRVSDAWITSPPGCPCNSAFKHLLDGQKEQKRQVERNPVESQRGLVYLQNKNVIINPIKVRIQN